MKKRSHSPYRIQQRSSQHQNTVSSLAEEMADAMYLAAELSALIERLMVIYDIPRDKIGELYNSLTIEEVIECIKRNTELDEETLEQARAEMESLQARAKRRNPLAKELASTNTRRPKVKGFG